MILRMFDTAVAPDDVERAKQLFHNQAKPAFDRFAGCQGIELFISLDDHSGGLADIAAISRWDSMERIEEAVDSDAYRDALRQLTELFQQSPIVRHFETAD